MYYYVHGRINWARPLYSLEEAKKVMDHFGGTYITENECGWIHRVFIKTTQGYMSFVPESD